MLAKAMIMPKKYFFDSNGEPLAFGKVYTYETGTTNNKTTYTTEDGDVANTNPVILNGEGYASIYLEGSYNIVVDDANDVNIWTEDPVSSNIAEEWINCQTPIYISPTSFKIAGNVTAEYDPGRRVKVDNDPALAYSTIKSSSFAASETTITLYDAIVDAGIIGVCTSILGKESKDKNRVLNYNTLTDLVSDVDNATIDDLFFLEERVSGEGGSGMWKAVDATTVTENEADIVTGNGTISFVLIVEDKADLKQFGGIGDDSTDNTTKIGLWLDYIIANNVEGTANDGTFAIDTTITKTLASGIKLTGNGIFKAGGVSREDMIIFNGVEGDVYIDVAFDGNNLVAKPFNLENENATATSLGDVFFGENSKFINAKNTTPATFFATGCAIQGGFNKIHFNGEIDSVEDTRTTGAQCAGLNVVQFAPADDYCRHLVVGSKSRIRNIKNSNTVTADADGVKHRATNLLDDATLSVVPGATFEECEGRAVKSQVPNTFVLGSRIHRSLYDGLVEIQAQYAGAVITDNLIVHDGVRVNDVIGGSQRLVPAISTFTIKNNRLLILSAGATDTEAFIKTDVTDATVKCAGVVIDGNSIIGGAVDYFYKPRCSDVVGNEVVVTNNHATTINTSFIHLWSHTGNPDLYIKFSGNSSDNAATGVSLASASYNVLARTWENNYNISDYKPHFKAYVSAQLVNVTGDGTTYDVVFDTEDFDPVGLFDNALSRFNAPVNGKLKLETSVDVSGITGMTDMTLQVRRTGSSTITDFVDRTAASAALSGGVYSPQGYSEIDVVAADQVRVQLRITGGALVADIDSSDKFSYIYAEFIPD